MAKKLWRVQVEWEYFAWAEDEDAARSHFDEASSDMDEWKACPWAHVAVRKDVPKEWLDCIPWGEDEDRTCDQLLTEAEAEAAENAAWEAHPKLPIEVSE